MTRRRRALFVAYQFPPVGGIGVHRVVKFTKFLPQFGWETSVLTVSNPSVPLTDHSLDKDIPESTEVVRARTLEPSYRWKQKFGGGKPKSGPATETKPSAVQLLKSCVKAPLRWTASQLLQPDLQVLWGPAAYRKGCELLSRKQHDVIIATAPPFSSFLVGERLAKKFGLPLVLDYRDEWGISNEHWENKQQSRSVQERQRKMQARLLDAATLALATTPSSCRSIQNAAAEASVEVECDYIYNGYDPDDFPKVEKPRVDYGFGTKRFRIVYAGTLWNLNSIQPLVDAIERIKERSPQLMEHLEVIIAGRRTDAQEQILNRLDEIDCPLVRLPFLSHADVIALMQDADCLILLNSPVRGAERIVNGKIFEYLATERPFLLISPKGDMWELTKDCPQSFPCDPNHPEQIAEQLAIQLERHRTGTPAVSSPWNAQQHERSTRAAELAKMLDRIVGHTQLESTMKTATQSSQLVSSTTRGDH